jgi:hypothetical protein
MVFSPQANYTDWSVDEFLCQLLQIERGAARPARRLIMVFYTGAAEWTPFQTNCYSENLVAPGIEPGASGIVASNSDHSTTDAVYLTTICEPIVQAIWDPLHGLLQGYLCFTENHLTTLHSHVEADSSVDG